IELGKMPVHESGGEDPLAQVVGSGRLTVHPEAASVIPHADVIVLCVGTPLAADLRADYHQLRSALASIAPHLLPGQLVIFRSTVSPGTLNKVVRPYLNERA